MPFTPPIEVSGKKFSCTPQQFFEDVSSERPQSNQLEKKFEQKV